LFIPFHFQDFEMSLFYRWAWNVMK